MDASTLSLIFQSASALAIFLVMALVWRTGQRIDVFRQRMFAIRDELFDYAEAGSIDFQNPAYQLLRNFMNGFIRYGHRLSFFQLMLTLLRWKLTEQVHPLMWHTKWNAAIESLPEDVRAKMIQFHGRAMDAVARHLVGGSVVLVLLCVVVVSQLLIRGAWTSIRAVLRDAAEEVITRILDPKVLEEEALRA
jgi:hypothetical protein